MVPARRNRCLLRRFMRQNVTLEKTASYAQAIPVSVTRAITVVSTSRELGKMWEVELRKYPDSVRFPLVSNPLRLRPVARLPPQMRPIHRMPPQFCSQHPNLLGNTWCYQHWYLLYYIVISSMKLYSNDFLKYDWSVYRYIYVCSFFLLSNLADKNGSSDQRRMSSSACDILVSWRELNEPQTYGNFLIPKNARLEGVKSRAKLRTEPDDRTIAKRYGYTLR